MPSLYSTCHCGATRQPISPAASSSEVRQVRLCHCTTCRRTSGQLYTSYHPISTPPNVANTTSYSPRVGHSTRYFCSTCGCHLFKRSNQIPLPDKNGNSEIVGESWEVSTGAVEGPVGGVQIISHAHVEDTRDGGLAAFFASS